jgi:hypothetical protein
MGEPGDGSELTDAAPAVTPTPVTTDKASRLAITDDLTRYPITVTPR